jgi:hypothetical protein
VYDRDAGDTIPLSDLHQLGKALGSCVADVRNGAHHESAAEGRDTLVDVPSTPDPVFSLTLFPSKGYISLQRILSSISSTLDLTLSGDWVQYPTRGLVFPVPESVAAIPSPVETSSGFAPAFSLAPFLSQLGKALGSCVADVRNGAHHESAAEGRDTLVESTDPDPLDLSRDHVHMEGETVVVTRRVDPERGK